MNKLLLGDFRMETKVIPNGTVDLVLTDPPYGKKFLDLWPSLAKIAKRVLRPNGYLVTYSGQMYLPQVMNALAEHLEYCGMICLKHAGRGKLIFRRNIINMWKPILVFRNGSMTEFYDGIIWGRKGDKRKHEWAQGIEEARELIRMFSKRGDLVLDPMVGSGTNLVAATIEKRRFIGIEINPKSYQIAKDWLNQVRSLRVKKEQ